MEFLHGQPHNTTWPPTTLFDSVNVVEIQSLRVVVKLRVIIQLFCTQPTLWFPSKHFENKFDKKRFILPA